MSLVYTCNQGDEKVLSNSLRVYKDKFSLWTNNCNFERTKEQTMLSSGRKNNCNFEELLACYYSYNALFNHFTFEYKTIEIFDL